MSADLLREAAALMREGAEAVPVDGLSDWWFDPDAPDLLHLRRHDREQIAIFGHPAVALAVADWLEDEAEWIEAGSTADGPAADVARTYLGRDA